MCKFMLFFKSNKLNKLLSYYIQNYKIYEKNLIGILIHGSVV